MLARLHNPQTLFAFRGWVLAAFFLVLLFSRSMSVSPLNLWGLILVAAGWGLRVAAGRSNSNNTNALQISGERLCTEGVYQWTRNPLYLGNIAVGFGMIIYSNSLSPASAAVLGLALVAHHYGVIRLEEKYLFRAFGEQYKTYARQTARWLTLRPAAAVSNPSVPWTWVWASQWANGAKTLLALLLIFIVHHDPLGL